jgi:hypothetical protein
MCSPLSAVNRRALLRACARDLGPRPARTISLQQSLEGAYAWLCRAQDGTADDGVAGWYHLFRGWAPSYPETTGYLIPTFLTYASVMAQPEARARALRMADWEVDVQLPSGAVRSGVLSTRVGPAVFNTGQVLFGWTAAYQTTGDDRYARAAQRAAEWLRRGQDTDGAWRKNLSLVAHSTLQTYNVRAAWGLAWAGQVLDEPRWIQAARKNCDWALRQQQRPTGWFGHNGFSDTEVPLLHTIGYVLEGLLGVGELLTDQRCVEAARSGIEPLAAEYAGAGRLAGRYDGQWRGTVRWRCLTGEAQLALVLARLARHAGGATATRMARALLEDVAGVQDLRGPYPETRGGISGSQPVWGGYSPFAYVSWAAKFQIDALLLCLFGADVHQPPARQASATLR